WGDNKFGQLGIGSHGRSRNVPVKLSLPLPRLGITRIAAGAFHNLALDNGGHLLAGGANESGQLRHRRTTKEPPPPPPRLPAGTPGIVTIAAGGSHSLAVDANGTLWAWGANDKGQLGNGTMTPSHVPGRVMYTGGATHAIVSVAAGTNHGLALESQSFLFG